MAAMIVRESSGIFISERILSEWSVAAARTKK
jgi:hypothetical protein